MRSSLLLIFVLALAATPLYGARKVVKVHTSSRSPSAPAPVLLHWDNGETIPGELLEATGTSVIWKTKLFEEPLKLARSALRGIDQRLEPVATTDPFAISLRDGSFLYGEIGSVSGQSVSIHSARHGDVVLKRSEILSLRRLTGGGLIVAGPTGDIGWKIPEGNRRYVDQDGSSQAPAVSKLTAGPAGALVMPYWNSGAVRELTSCPDLVDVEFHVRSSARLDFQFSLRASPIERLSVETWGDDLVLVSDDQFKLIRKIAENERDLALRLCWDRKTWKCSVFTPEGDFLTDWIVPNDTNRRNGNPMLELQSKGRDLSLELLRVRVWDGKPPAKVDVKQPRIELADGRTVSGVIVDGPAGLIKVRTSGTDTATSFPLSGVNEVVFSGESLKAGALKAPLSYVDGTMLKGKVSSIASGSARIAASFSEAPFPSRMDGLRRWIIHTSVTTGTTSEPPTASLDTLVVDETTFHGKFVAMGDGRMRWLPVGGVSPAIVAKSLPAEITRALPKDAQWKSAPALFHASTGDVLPGTLNALDRDGVQLESGIVEATKLRSDDLNAIQFNPAIQTALHGFGSSGWIIVKGNETSVRRTNEMLTMDPETALAHPSGMQCGEIAFTIEPTTYATIRLRMFCAGTDRAKSQNLMMMRSGLIYLGMEGTEGQLENQIQVRVAQGKPVSVRLCITEKDVTLFIDGCQTQVFPIGPEKRAGSGLIIEPAGLWGNTVNPISLSNFSASSPPGLTWLPGVDSETKSYALTIPRFRKDAPPRHVLLAANGDVLRGEIEAITATHFGFRSGLENLRVPRDRVKAAIWLKAPETRKAVDERKAGPGGDAKPPMYWLMLTNGARLGLVVEKFEPDFVSGTHSVFGHCKVPMSEVYVIRTSAPTPSAAMEALKGWRLAYAPEPVLPTTGGESSPSLGKEAAAFKLPLLGGGEFELGKEKGKVVVLDFWASWCGPCIKSLPGLIQAISTFPADRVKLIGVNQGETPEQVKRFLETRGWKLTVALDAGQSVAQQYGVDGIPHTVIVGPDGKVAWVKTGFTPEGEAEAAAAVKRLLAPSMGLPVPNGS